MARTPVSKSSLELAVYRAGCAVGRAEERVLREVREGDSPSAEARQALFDADRALKLARRRLTRARGR
jgi:hypothetical protein